ncbi:MAG: hypothetical protein ABL903_14445 [Methylococcales bacterium]
MNARYLEQYRPLFFLGIACFLTSGFIVWEWRVIDREQFSFILPHYESNALNLERLTMDQALLLPLQEYQEMVKVPLFFEGREEVAVISSVDESALKLTGVVLTPHGFVALVRDEQGAYHKLDQGHEVLGWTVAAVKNDRVELVRNAESRELTLFEGRNRHDLTAQELEDCFKNQADLPLEECFKHPEKYAGKSKGGVAT